MSDRDTQEFKSDNIIQSFDYALKGFVYALRTEKNMRIHIIAALMVTLGALFLNLSRLELALLIMVISLVIICEIINTAVEHLVNMVTERHHPLAKIVKDLTAAAVFFASICAVSIGYLLIVRRETLRILSDSIVIERVAAYPPHFAAAVAFTVLLVSLIIKSVVGKNPSIEGGMPSIHTSLAFSLATMVFIASSSVYVFILALLLALMVAQARISGGIHSLWEVVAGAILGTSLTLFLFQVLL